MTTVTKLVPTNWIDTYQFSRNPKYLGHGNRAHCCYENSSVKRSSDAKNTLLLGRADWHLRANALVIAYLVAALFSGIFVKGAEGGQPAWLTVHLLLLGAVTNAIVTWSDHFVSALLWARTQNRTRQMRIVLLLNIGIIGVLISVSRHLQWLVTISATLIVFVIAFYLRGMTTLIKRSLNKRFTGVIAFYQWAGLMILVGIFLGVLDASKGDKDIWQSRITLAHLHANLLGWVGLTIIGTLVTLWPTVLRTQMHPDAISRAKLGLKILIIGTGGAIVGALFDQPWILELSIAMYLLGVIVTLLPAGVLLRKRIPDQSSSWMMFSGALGLAFLLIGDFCLVIVARTPEKILTAIEAHLLLIFTLWLLPILLGALTYLLPVVLGRGPASNRRLEVILNFGWKWRIFLLPLSSALQISPNRFHIVGQLLAALALGIFLILSVIVMRKSRSVTTSL
jgi:nitrite reductase (NO-forming)